MDYSRFYCLLKQLQHTTKEALILQYSDGRTSSLREFAKDTKAYNRMIQELARLVDAKSVKAPVQDEAEKRRYRSLILKAMDEQGIKAIGADWRTVNQFVKDCSKTNKTLQTMSLEQLKTFNKQVHKLLDWHNAKKEQYARLALSN